MTASSPTALSSSVAEQLAALCDGYVVDHRTDLDRDRESIDAAPGVPFVCISRATGTHLLQLFPADHPGFPPAGVTTPYCFGSVPREHVLAGTAKFIRTQATGPDVEHRRWFLYRGTGKVRRVEPAEALKFSDAWERRVESEWRREAR